jgi:hypothetical protein
MLAGRILSGHARLAATLAREKWSGHLSMGRCRARLIPKAIGEELVYHPDPLTPCQKGT